MKPIVNRKKMVQSHKKGILPSGSNPWNLSYDTNQVEYLGMQSSGAANVFGKKERDLFIFRINDLQAAKDKSEAFLVIACP